jgi:small subunit ribosomal protein S19
MTRSLLKSIYFNNKLVKKLSAKQNKIKIKTWSRSTTILPQFVSESFDVYNGLRFINIKINSEMIGHKLGEFVPTRKPCLHTKLKNKK